MREEVERWARGGSRQKGRRDEEGEDDKRREQESEYTLILLLPLTHPQTYISDILIAVNPFKSLPLYTPEVGNRLYWRAVTRISFLCAPLSLFFSHSPPHIRLSRLLCLPRSLPRSLFLHVSSLL